MQKDVKFDIIRIKNADKLVSFYCETGGNGLPHWHFVDPKRAKEIFNEVLPNVKGKVLKQRCEEILNQLS